MQTRTCIAETILEQNDEAADNTRTGFKTHCKTAITKTAAFTTTTPDKRKRVEIPEIIPYIYSKLRLNKGIKKTHTHQRKGNNSSVNELEVMQK